jgi:hypothetical protein
MIHAVAGLRPRTTIVHDAVLVGYRAIANAPPPAKARPACDVKEAPLAT